MELATFPCVNNFFHFSCFMSIVGVGLSSDGILNFKSSYGIFTSAVGDFLSSCNRCVDRFIMLGLVFVRSILSGLHFLILNFFVSLSFSFFAIIGPFWTGACRFRSGL